MPETQKGKTRYPVFFYVEEFESNPNVEFPMEPVRSSYDLNFTAQQLVKLRDDIEKALAEGITDGKIIRFIVRRGR
jgi:hypothetical protein